MPIPQEVSELVERFERNRESYRKTSKIRLTASSHQGL